MKTLIFILSLLASHMLFLNVANAQVNASMQVSVKVISGAGFTHNDFQISSEKQTDGNIKLTAAPNTEMIIVVNDQVTASNQFGEWINLTSDYSVVSDSGAGEHFISYTPKIDVNSLRGKYSGTMTTTIEYL